MNAMTSKTKTILAVLTVLGAVAALVTYQLMVWIDEARASEAEQAQFAESTHFGASIPPHTPPLEEMILDAPAVARVSFIEAEARTWEDRKPSEPYVAYMALKFQVLEYLKGGAGLDTIWGGLGLEDAEGATEQEALDKAQRYLNERDTSLDDREAILIFQPSSGTRDDLYSIGWIGPRSNENPWRRWLPAAVASGGASGSSGEPQFLWDDSRRWSAGASGASGASGGAVTLTELRGLSGLTDAELAKRAIGIYGFVEVVEDHSSETGIYLLTAKTTSGQVTLDWDTLGSDVTGVIGYRILRRKQSDAEFLQLVDIRTGDTEYVDTHRIEPETEYVYVVRAYTASSDIGDVTVTITTAAELESLPSGATPTPIPTATPTYGATGQ